MNNHDDVIILSELNTDNKDFKPSIQIAHALAEIKDTFQTPLLAKIPFAKIASLGGAFSVIPDALMTPTGEGIYRCVFPKGISGTLALAKDGSGALGAIINEGGIAAQARWVHVGKAIGPAVWKGTLIAVAVLGVVKQISDIKDGQKEIIGILERDKKSQLIADYDILSAYMDDYKYYCENEVDVIVNLNQVKNIKRNAQKDIRSYMEQIEDIVNAKKNILKMQSTSQKIGKLLDCFVRYKLALHVYAISDYMEVMLAKNFQAEYLDKIAQELRNYSFRFKELYTQCYEKINILKNEAFTTQAANKFADVAKLVGSSIGKIPVIKKGSVDEFLVDLGKAIDETEKKQLQKTLEFFMKYKDSGIVSIAEHIDIVNHISNKPTVLLCDNNVICFSKLQQAV